MPLVAYPDKVISDLEKEANLIRRHVIKMIRAAGSGHPGGSLSSADILAALYFKVMNHRPDDPTWEDRDRFVLSKGHAAPAYYAALAESGYFPIEELLTLRKLGSRLQGHPSRNKLPGVEMSTGSLGQGLSVATAWRWPRSWTARPTASTASAATGRWRAARSGRRRC